VCSVKIVGNLRCEGVRRGFVFLPPVLKLGEIIKEQKLSLTDLTEDDATRVGRLLNADFLVIGSFQKLDLGPSITLKINTRVVNMTTGEIDSGKAVSVNGPYAQVFTIQDDIAAKLARNLGAHLADDELMLMSRDETASVVAYELYNLARYEKSRDRKEDLLLRALELDPAYGKAHLKLGSFYMTRVLSDQSLEPTAVNHLIRALALDPNLAEGHYVLGEFYYRKVREGGLKNDIKDEFRRDGIHHLNQFITSKENSEACYYTRKVDKARRMLKKL